jgi:hypothetical protein
MIGLMEPKHDFSCPLWTAMIGHSKARLFEIHISRNHTNTFYFLSIAA